MCVRPRRRATRAVQDGRLGALLGQMAISAGGPSPQATSPPEAGPEQLGPRTERRVRPGSSVGLDGPVTTCWPQRMEQWPRMVFGAGLPEPQSSLLPPRPT